PYHGASVVRASRRLPRGAAWSPHPELEGTPCPLNFSLFVEGQMGVPAVVEQKTTILRKCLSLLASLKDSPGLGGAYQTNSRGGDENPVHGRNTTINVDKSR